MRLFFAVTLLVVLFCLGNVIVRAQYFPDTIVLKSGQHVEGKITSESEQSVTVSIDTSTGKTERTIPKSDISSVFRAPPARPAQTPIPLKETKVPSPDKRWEYVGGEEPRICKAGTNDVVLDLSEQSPGKLLWAPDSKRFAFNYGQGRTHQTLVYQLREDQWVALHFPGNSDEFETRADEIVAGQLKKDGLSEKKLEKQGKFLRLIWSTMKVDQWLDSNTAIVHVSLRQVAARRDAPGEMDNGYGADLLYTVTFDEAGTWKVVKTHEMTGKAAESPSMSSPLADKVLYRSPHGNYRIQANADGTALWIVPQKDPNQRKPLLGADPDNRSSEEFSSSPDEKWLFDNRQHELYRDNGNFVFSPLNKKQWFWKIALDYAAKQFHFARKDTGGESAGWSFDLARMLIKFNEDNVPRFAYFNTRTKAFEQTPYLQAVNRKLNTEKPWEAFPQVAFAGERLGSYMVFAEPIDSPPSEATLKARFTALDEELKTLRVKQLADLATRKDSTTVEFWRDENDKWNKARTEAVQLYLPFASDAEKETRKLQFLCDLTQREVNGLKKTNAE